MEIEDAKLLIQAYMDVNKTVRKAILDNKRAFDFVQTDEYWQNIIEKYNTLKNKNI